MSEKNGEIASELYDQIEDMTSAPIPVDCKKIIHEALDQKDRDHEAEINKLQSLLERSKFAVERCLSDKELNDVATRLLKEIMETPFGNQLATPIPADHEALIGVLVGALENLIKAQDERLQLKYSATGRPEIGSWLWDEARTALSLSESRGVKKGMMRAADIAKKVGCEPCGDIIAQAIRIQAESDPPTPVDEGNEGIAQIGFDASRGLISGNLAKSKLLEALSAKDEIIKELREKLSNS